MNDFVHFIKPLFNFIQPAAFLINIIRVAMFDYPGVPYKFTILDGGNGFQHVKVRVESKLDIESSVLFTLTI